MSYLSTVTEFPFCIPEFNASDVGPATRHCIALTLDELYIWFYRIKKWKIDYTYAPPPGTGIPEFSDSFIAVAGIYSSSGGVVTDNTIADEARLTCVSNKSGEYSAVGRTASFRLFASSSPARCAKVGDSFYPNIIAAIQGTAPNSDGGGTLVEVGTFTADGKSTPLYGSSEVTASVVAAPFEYWPYDPGDTEDYPGKDGSGPVYDSATGEQLRDPFTIVKRGDGTFYNPSA